MTTGSESPSADSGSDPQSSSRNGKEDSSPSKKARKNDSTKIIQVANIAPQTTREQMLALFGCLGKVDDLRLYPTIDIGAQITSKICFVKFYDSSSVGISQHLTNTVFIDRALIVIPYIDGDIPDEQRGIELLNSGTLLPGITDPKLPQHVTSQLEGVPPNQVVSTNDPKLLENNLPRYPVLPNTFDTRKIEEIRRTVMAVNIDPEIKSQDLVDFFNQVGEVKYLRVCTRDNDPLLFALIEYSEQPSVLSSLKLNGTKLGSNVLKMYHATQAINKPQAKTNEAAQKEIEDAMSRQAQTLLSQGIENNPTPQTMGPSKDLHRGSRRSRSRDRDRRRSRSRSSRRRSRSRSHRRSSSRRRRSVHRKGRSRSRSRDRVSRRRSRSHGRYKVRSRTPSVPRKSRSRSRKRDGDRDRRRSSKKHKDRKREKDEKRDKEGREERAEKDKDKDERSKDRDDRKDKEDKDKDRKEKDRSRDKEKDRNVNTDFKENGVKV